MYSKAVYEKFGEKGPVIIGLHGWGQTLEALKPMAELLAENNQVYLFDLPGFGKAKAPPTTWDSFAYGEYILQTMQQLGIDTFSLFGHSFGGKVAMSIAASNPKKVRSLILLATSGLKKKHSLQQKIHFKSISAFRKLIKTADRLLKTNWFETFFIPRFASKDYKNAGNMRPVLVKSVTEDFTPHLKRICCPTLILWGDKDTETPVEMAYRLQQGIQHSKLLIFTHKDHYLFNQCGHHLCAYYMNPFLKEIHG